MEGRARLFIAFYRPQVDVLLLRPMTRLRFRPTAPDAAWGQPQAVKGARLIFTAWDMSDVIEGDNGDAASSAATTLTVDAPYCCAQKVSSSISAAQKTLFVWAARPE